MHDCNNGSLQKHKSAYRGGPGGAGPEVLVASGSFEHMQRCMISIACCTSADVEVLMSICMSTSYTC